MNDAIRRSVPLADVAGASGLLVDGDWVETKDQNPAGEVRLIQLADVGIGEYLDKSNRRLTSETARRLRCTMLRENDILIARMPDPIGRACLFPGDPSPCVTVVDVCVVRPDPQVAEPRYLLHLLNSEGFQARITGLVKGATRQRVSRGNLQQIGIPLPRLDEQRRIAVILDQADDLRRKRREALALLQTVNRIIFLEMFGDPLANNLAWPTVRLGDAGALDRGVSKHRPRNDPALLEGPYPLIQTGEVTNSDGYIRNFTSTYSELGLRQSKLWPKGTLCITIAANIGKTGILAFDACFPDSVVGFAPGNGVRTEFVQQWFAFVQPALERDAPQFAQKNINLAILRELTLINPPFDLQCSFADRVAEIVKLKTHHRAHLSKLDALFTSLQHRAFRGKL